MQAKLLQALALHRQGRLEQARAIYLAILRAEADHADALHLLGVIEHQFGNHLKAVELMDRAIEIDAGQAAFHCNRGSALQGLERYAAAIASFDAAIRIKPDYPEAHSNRGNALVELERYDAAIASYDEAIRIRPDYAEAYYNRGNALLELGRHDAAIASFDEAIRIKPDYAQAHSNRGNGLVEARRYDAAIASFDDAICVEPKYVEAYYNRGVALTLLKRCDAAVASFKQAIRIKPDYAAAHFNLGNALHDLKRYDAALASFDEAMRIRPDYEYALGARLHSKMFACDWRGLDRELDELAARIRAGEKASLPFPVLALTASPLLQQRAAAIYVHDRYPANSALGGIGERPERQKLRIGYYSADFHDHATAYLMAELFEKHDRQRFELFGLSFGPDRADGMRRRISCAFDSFIDVRDLPDQTVAQMSRDLGIDIAIDLKGFTQDQRPKIFSFRAAPVQVSYLGYPGTMAAEYMDYLIADRTLIPDESRAYYSERIVYLPDSYQVNDTKRGIAEEGFSRAELGLPEEGFVFCCFNNSFKITPAVFDRLMSILARVESSVLWLLEDNPLAVRNLGNEAERRGVNRARLIFAKRMPLAQHLARHRVADLFLDTLPYNAHTTASDSLWAGLPVLTCRGESFASRVAASLLNAIGLPEMIAAGLEEYEDLAVDLATDGPRLNAIRKALERNRLTTPLFDSSLFARHIEAAYLQMHERHRAGLPPEHIAIALP